MLTRDDVLPLLLEACPSLAATWDPTDNEDEGTRLHYLDAGDVARHLVDLIAAGGTAEVAPAFTVIERLHTEGDAYVRELATIGYLEGMQNVASHRDDVDLDAALAHLGPESRRWWRGLEEFWDGRAPAVRPVDG